MFDIGFSEIVLIFGLALVVLGPEKLPKLAATIGRWVGRARAMARQFHEQLETEAESIKSSVSDVQTDLQNSVSELKSSVSDLNSSVDAAGQQVSSIAQQATAAVSTPPPSDDTKHNERGI
jgi:sec-independent protein translocase protein TatB